MAIDERSGIVRTVARLDRDVLCTSVSTAETCQVRLDIVVQPMSHFRIVTVAVDLVDINDNSPQFDVDFLSHDLGESSLPGEAIVLPAPQDADTGINSVQRYRLDYVDERTSAAVGKDDFELRATRKLDGSTELKLVLVKRLDREAREQYRLRVVAVDGGDPPRSGSIDVVIRVLDANDNVPVFDRAVYEATVAENCPLRTTVATVKAVDRDAGPNAVLSYYLSAATAANYGRTFAVNNVTGDVYVTGRVDYESTPVYRLLVSARDSGPEAVSADAAVIVRVSDVNDNAPRIVINTLLASDTDVATVPENARPETFVAHALVVDPDSGDNGRVDCSLDAPGSHFRLKPMYGAEYQIVTSGEPLDRETTDRYLLRLFCLRLVTVVTVALDFQLVFFYLFNGRDMYGTSQHR